jgi:hypothetical protein
MDISNQINNIYKQPDVFEKQLFHRSDRETIKLLKTYAIYTCRDLISEKYIKISFSTFNRGYIYKINNEIVGFVIWSIKSYPKYSLKLNRYNLPNPMIKYLHVLLICDNFNNYNLYKQLLYDVEQFALLRRINKVTIIPINEDLSTFYEKNGFKIVSEYPQTLMLKNLEKIELENK